MSSNKKDKILELLQKCNRNAYKDDLHSFVALISNGKGSVWVDCRGYEIFIETHTFGSWEMPSQWSGTLEDAAYLLELYDIDLSSVEM